MFGIPHIVAVSRPRGGELAVQISEIGVEFVFEQQGETQVSEISVEIVMEQDATSYPAYVNGNTYTAGDIVYYSGDGNAYIADSSGTSTGADPKTATGVTWRVYAS